MCRILRVRVVIRCEYDQVDRSTIFCKVEGASRAVETGEDLFGVEARAGVPHRLRVLLCSLAMSSIHLLPAPSFITYSASSIAS